MAVVPFRGSRITARDVLADVNAARVEIARVDTKLEVLNAGRAALVADIADHETRIRAGERWQWRAAGGLGALALVAGVLSGWLSAVLIHAHP